MTILVVAEAVVIVLLAILVVGMLRSHAEILRKLHELGAGESAETPFRTVEGVSEPSSSSGTAHDLTGTTPTGGAIAIRVTNAPHPTLLAFMSTTCPTCEQLWPAFADPAAVSALGGIRLVIVTKGQEDEMPARVADLAPAATTLVMSTRAWEDYGIPGSPYFVMVGAGGSQVIGEGSAGTWDKLLDLMGIADGDVPASPHSHDAERAERIDRELADAGILPGDPQLYGEHGLQAESDS